MEPAIVIVAIYPYNDFEGFCGAQIGANIEPTPPEILGAASRNFGCPILPATMQYERSGPRLGETAIGSLVSDWSRTVQTWSPMVAPFGRRDVYRVSTIGVEASFALPERRSYKARLESQRGDEAATRQFLDAFMADFAARARASNATPLIVIVPSKERVYDHVGSWRLPHEVLALLGYEGRWTADVAMRAGRNNLAVCDLTSSISLAITSGMRVYPQSDGSHPIATGYAVYADAIELCLLKQGVLPLSAPKS